MNLRKSVHILLATLLCFGQLAASAHVVGHFQLHNLSSQPEIDTGHAHVHAAVSGHHHDNTPIGSPAKHDNAVVAQDTSDKGAVENDCAIYHVFLSLGGVMSGGLGEHATLVPCEGLSSYAKTYSPHFLLGHTRIRAPPSIS